MTSVADNTRDVVNTQSNFFGRPAHGRIEIIIGLGALVAFILFLIDIAWDRLISAEDEKSDLMSFPAQMEHEKREQFQDCIVKTNNNTACYIAIYSK